MPPSKCTALLTVVVVCAALAAPAIARPNWGWRASRSGSKAPTTKRPTTSTPIRRPVSAKPSAKPSTKPSAKPSTRPTFCPMGSLPVPCTDSNGVSACCPATYTCDVNGAGCSPPVCFWGSSRVVVREEPNGQVMERPIAELRLGDVVRVADPTSGRLEWEPVLFFGKVARNATSAAVRVGMENGRELVLSHVHVVFAKVEKEGGEIKEVMAQDLKPGFVVLAGRDGGSKQDLVETRVVSVTRDETSTGFFSPHTASGTVVVEGALASCHSKRTRAFRSVVLRPLVWLYQLVGVPGAGSLPPEGQHPYLEFTNELLKRTVGHDVGVVGRVESE